MLTCNMSVWKGLTNRIRFEDCVSLKDALLMRNDYQKDAAIFGARLKDWSNILYSIVFYGEQGDIVEIACYKETAISDGELQELIGKYPNAEFGVLYASAHRNFCTQILEEERSKKIRPITLREANAFIKGNHRHHGSVTGCKFTIGLFKTRRNGQNSLIGVAICGRPVSRHLDDGLTLEINRLCTTERGNCCSMLYGACSRIARDMGYERVITYILRSEDGASLKASNFVLEDAECGGKEWTGSRESRSAKQPPREMKQRWVKVLNNRRTRKNDD